jgi:hypothetical protein
LSTPVGVGQAQVEEHAIVLALAHAALRLGERAHEIQLGLDVRIGQRLAQQARIRGRILHHEQPQHSAALGRGGAG